MGRPLMGWKRSSNRSICPKTHLFRYVQYVDTFRADIVLYVCVCCELHWYGHCGQFLLSFFPSFLLLCIVIERVLWSLFPCNSLFCKLQVAMRFWPLFASLGGDLLSKQRHAKCRLFLLYCHYHQEHSQCTYIVVILCPLLRLAVFIFLLCPQTIYLSHYEQK